MQFVPLWDSILDSLKMHKLGPERLGRWVLLLLTAQRHDAIEGSLPDIDTIAFWLRYPASMIQEWIDDLVRSRMIDWRDKKYWIHDWQHWRCRGDFGAAERMRRMRERRKNGQPDNDGAMLRNAVTPPLRPPVTSHVPPELEEEEAEASEASAEASSASPRAPAREEKFPAPNPGGNTDPACEKICTLAAEIGGDVSWSLWASRRIQLGDSPAVLEAALRAGVDTGKLNQSYVGKIAARFAVEGIPVHKNGNGKPAPTVTDGCVTPEIEERREATAAETKRMLAEYRERMKNGHKA
jgi:hypothetical protein